jgi:hypothetical protein
LISLDSLELVFAADVMSEPRLGAGEEEFVEEEELKKERRLIFHTWREQTTKEWKDWKDCHGIYSSLLWHGVTPNSDHAARPRARRARKARAIRIIGPMHGGLI